MRNGETGSEAMARPLVLFKNYMEGKRKTPRRTSWWSEGGQALLRTEESGTERAIR